MLAIGTLILASGLASASVGVTGPSTRALPASTYDEAACEAVLEAALTEPADEMAPFVFEAECAPLVARALDGATCSLFGELPRACEAPARRLLLLRRPDTLRANRAHDAALRASADGPRCLPDAAPPTVRDPSTPMLIAVAPRLPRTVVGVLLPLPPSTIPRDAPRGRLERPPRA